MSNCKQLEVHLDDQNPHKWSQILADDVFKKFISQGSPVVHKIFGDGSLFSPLLFGKFFDPSDAFPLWEFESDVLLSNLKSTGRAAVDWLQTDKDYVLKAELPGDGKLNIQVCVDKGKIVEIYGQWNQQKDTKDWSSGKWWEIGFVRRLELPQDADCKKVQAYLANDTHLEIKIPKRHLDGDSSSQADDAKTRA